MKRLLAVIGLMLLLTTAVAAQGSPYITITSPFSGEQIANPANGFGVSGNAGFLNDVITVQALDANNQILAQTTTNNPQPEGQWAASLMVSYNGPGRIVALAGNNATQSIDATAEVAVTFGAPATAVPPTAVPPTQPPQPTRRLNRRRHRSPAPRSSSPARRMAAWPMSPAGR